jgi:hypothetical protein
VGIVVILATYPASAAESPYKVGEEVTLWGNGETVIVFTDEKAPSDFFLRGDDPMVILRLLLSGKILKCSAGTKAIIVGVPSNPMLGPGGLPVPIWIRVNVRINEGDHSGKTGFLPAEWLKSSKDKTITGGLHDAVKDKNVESIKTLLAKGSNVNATDAEGKTPLIYAVRLGLKDITKLLLTGGARMELRDNSGASALWYAASAGHKEVVELLLANGANIHLMDNDGYTPLHEAAGGGHKDVVRLLLSHGADVDVAAKNEKGWTPLHFAVLNFALRKGDREVIELLLASGANPNIRSKDGKSPLDMAEDLAVKNLMPDEIIAMLKKNKGVRH